MNINLKANFLIVKHICGFLVNLIINIKNLTQRIKLSRQKIIKLFSSVNSMPN